MRKLMLLAACLSAAFLSVAQDKTINDDHAQVRPVGAFHGIRISHGIDLYLTQGSEDKIAVSASSNEYRDRIKTEVENGVLRIYMEPQSHGFSWSSGNHKLKAYVSVKSLDQLNASGGSDVLLENTINADRLAITLSGGSDLKGTVQVHELTLNQSGGSDVNISGKVVNLKADNSGGSDLKGYELATDYCDINTSGGSDVQITVNKELSVSASGSSDVNYKGSGVVKSSHTSGSSSISRKG